MQLLLSGQADVVGGSFVSDLQVIEKGQDLRVFCPAWRGFASRVIGVGDVTELEQVADPNTRIAVESPGGPVNFFFDLVLQTRGVDASTRTFENIAVIEDGPLRMGALANGDVDVALISASLVPQLVDEVGAKDVHVLSDVMEDVGTGAIFATLAAKKDWLDDHIEEAGAVCASVIKASQEYLDDYGFFARHVDQYIEADLGNEELRPVWQETKEDTLWPLEPVLDEDGVNLVIETAKETELLPETSELTYDSVIDERPMERARELLEEDA
jgi:ABC-type nitrate/sulfonate/bicarbonate transport system substrate-binding protein